MLKIFKVSFNDGGWHTSLPSFTTVAKTQEEAIQNVLIENKHYTKENGWSAYASEFKIDGYVIEVYNEKTYKREKNIEKLNIN